MSIMYNRNTDEENQRFIDEYMSKNGSQPSDYSMPDTVDVMPGDQEYSAPHPDSQWGTAVGVPAEEDQWGTAEPFETKYSPEKYNEVNPDRPNLPDEYVAPSLLPDSAFTKPKAERGYERNPLDYTSKNDDLENGENDRRHLIRTYLEQTYGKAADSSAVDDARSRASTINNMADIGHGLDRMFTAHSAARGGQGVDNAFWSGMKQDAQQGVQNADSERKAKISDYLAKKNLGRQGVADLQQQNEWETKNSMLDPYSKISKSYQDAFKGMFPAESDNMDLSTMSANDISQMAKMYQTKQLADSNVAYKSGMLGVKQQEFDPNSAENRAKAKISDNNVKISENNVAASAARAASIKSGNPTSGAMSIVPNVEYEGVGVMRDKEGNFYDFNKNKIADPSKIVPVDPASRKATSEAQTKMGMFWSRADRAHSGLNDLATKGYSAPSNSAKQIAVDNYLMSNGTQRMIYKKFLNEKDLMFANENMNFLNAVLRQDSGAAIPESEYAKYKPLLPEAGDTPKILAQKSRERESMIHDLGVGAGERFTKKINDDKEKSGKRAPGTIVTVKGQGQFTVGPDGDTLIPVPKKGS